MPPSFDVQSREDGLLLTEDRAIDSLKGGDRKKSVYRMPSDKRRSLPVVSYDFSD